MHRIKHYDALINRPTQTTSITYKNTRHRNILVFAHTEFSYFNARDENPSVGQFLKDGTSISYFS